MTLKVIEFRAHPTPDQISKIRDWQYGLTKFWNFVLGQMVRLDDGFSWCKTTKQYNPSCFITNKVEITPPRRLLAEFTPMAKVTTQRGLDRVKNKPVLYTSAKLSWMTGWHGGWGYSCPISPASAEGCLIRSFRARDSKKGLAVLNKSSMLKEAPDWLISPHNRDAILAVPYKYRQSLLEDIGTAWDEYLKTRIGKATLARGKPKFKSISRDKIKTVSPANPNAGTSKPQSQDAVRPLEDDLLKVPGLKSGLKVDKLHQRFALPDGSFPRVKVFRIVERCGEWFIQLTCESKPRKPVIKLRKAVAIDPGQKEENWLSFSNGRVKSKPKYAQIVAERKAKTQREIQLKLDHKLILWLHHPQTTFELIKSQLPSITDEHIIKLKSCRTVEDLRKITSQDGGVPNSIYQRLRWRGKFAGEDVPFSESKGIKKLKLRLSKLDNLAKQQRKHNNQKTSTYLSRRHPVIVVEDGLQKSVGKSKAKPKEDGSGFEKNNRASNKGHNKSRLEMGYGGFVDMLERKSEEMGHKVIRTKAAYTSTTCPVCYPSTGKGNNPEWGVKNMKDEKSVECKYCGYYHFDRDVSASVFMLIECYDQGKVELRWLDDFAKTILEARRDGGY